MRTAVTPKEDRAALQALARDSAADAGPSRGNFCDGVVESVWLLFAYPAFAFAVLAWGFGSAAPPILNSLVVPELQYEVWGVQAAANGSWVQAFRGILGILFCPFFGRWSDRKGRRTVLALSLALNGLLPALACLVGNSESRLVTYSALSVLSGMTGAGISGCPLIFALVADLLPTSHRETGLGVLGAVSFSCSLLGPMFGQAVGAWFHQSRDAICLLSALVSVVSVILLVPVKTSPAEPCREDDDSTALFSPLAPLRLAWRKRSVLYAAGAAGLLVLPEVAGFSVAAPFLFQLLGITGPGDVQAQMNTCLQFMTYPSIATVAAYLVMGVLCRRFGPASVLVTFVPLGAVAFSAPALLEIAALQTAWGLFLTGVGLQLSLAAFVPLQSLVAHSAPASRVGEAMGAVASAKSLCSVLAPTLAAAGTQALAAAGRTELAWLLFPCGSVLLLLSWPLCWLLRRRLPKDSHAAWSSWCTEPRFSRLTARSSHGRRSQRNTAPSAA